MDLGSGFAAALKEEASEGSGELAALFGKALDQLGEKLYRRLRDDLIAEVRAEVQRTEGTGLAKAVVDALAKIGTPQVHVAAPPAPNVTVDAAHIEVLPPDVTVNTPKPDAPKVTVQGPKKIKVLRDAEGQITGAEVS